MSSFPNSSMIGIELPIYTRYREKLLIWLRPSKSEEYDPRFRGWLEYGFDPWGSP